MSDKIYANQLRTGVTRPGENYIEGPTSISNKIKPCATDLFKEHLRRVPLRLASGKSSGAWYIPCCSIVGQFSLKVSDTLVREIDVLMALCTVRPLHLHHQIQSRFSKIAFPTRFNGRLSAEISSGRFQTPQRRAARNIIPQTSNGIADSFASHIMMYYRLERATRFIREARRRGWCSQSIPGSLMLRYVFLANGYYHEANHEYYCEA